MALQTRALKSLLSVLASAPFLMMAQAAQAKVTIPVVDGSQYDKYASRSAWSQTPVDEVPEGAITLVDVETPSHASSGEYPNVFFQNERVVVCFAGRGRGCDDLQDIDVQAAASGPAVTEFKVGFDLAQNRKRAFQTLRLTNTYFWINRLFDQMREIGFTPSRRLVVLVDRDVQDPETGAVLENNAFFNSGNWTLSFLPISNNFFIKNLAGFTFVNPAYDPSVIMHETTHAVFQELIGSILNTEILGLHEAFADYFSLATLNSTHLGAIMGSGKPIRENSKPMTYKKNMEAHALGNVICSTLVQIRQLFEQNDVVGLNAGANPEEILAARRAVADTLALQVVREFGKNPFTIASNIVEIYMSALKKSGRLSVDVQNKIQAAWDATGMKPVQKPVDLAAIRNFKASDTPYFQAMIETINPDSSKREFGSPLRTVSYVTYLGELPGLPDTNTVLYRLSVMAPTQKKQPTNLIDTPIWILYSTELKATLGAYDRNGQLIEAGDPLFKTLLVVNENLKEILSWKNGQPSALMQLARLSQATATPATPDLSKLLKVFRLTNVRNSTEFLRMNDALRQVQVTSADVEQTIFGSIVNFGLGQLDPGIAGALFKLKHFDMYTIDPQTFPNLQSPQLDPSHRLIGFRTVTKTGQSNLILIQNLSPTLPVLQPPLKETETTKPAGGTVAAPAAQAPQTPSAQRR